MQVISSIDAYYPSFPLGGEPTAVKCQLSIISANDKLYLKTPFAFLNAYAALVVEFARAIAAW